KPFYLPVTVYIFCGKIFLYMAALCCTHPRSGLISILMPFLLGPLCAAGARPDLFASSPIEWHFRLNNFNLNQCGHAPSQNVKVWAGSIDFGPQFFGDGKQAKWEGCAVVE